MRTSVVFLALSTVTVPALAATPPDRMNYQGVLRSSAGAPLDGPYDMVLRFWDGDVAGNELLIDRHTAATAGAVVVTGGLFDVALGGGMVEDGAGSGTYATLADVFRNHTDVWLEIEVAGETLSPRIKVASAAYALNSESLGGKSASDFLDTSAAAQTKSGQLSISAPVGAPHVKLAGGNWDTTVGDGDLKIGDDTYRFRLGVATGGGGAGDVRLNAVGGTNRMMLGGGTGTDLTLWNGKVGINNPTPTYALDVAGNSRFGDHLFVSSSMTVEESPGFFDIAFLDGGAIWADTDVFQVLAGSDDTDQLLLTAGNGLGDGSIRIHGGGPIDIHSAAGVSFRDTSFATQAFLDSTGLDLTGGTFGLANATLSATSTGLNVSPGGGATGDLVLDSGGGVNGGQINIQGGSSMLLTSGNGAFAFRDGTGLLTSFLLERNPPSYRATLFGDLILSRDIRLGLPTASSTISSGASADAIILTSRNGYFQLNHGAEASTLATLDSTGNWLIDGSLRFGPGQSELREFGSFRDVQIFRYGSTSYFQVYNSAAQEQMRIQNGDEAATNFDGAVNANGIDYAEAFHVTDSTLEPGDVVVHTPGAPGSVERSAGEYARGLVGVVSLRPGFVTGNSFDAEESADAELAAERAAARRSGDHDTARRITEQLIARKNERMRPVALLGRVPVKVDGAFGVIRAGDVLTSSPTPGHAMALAEPGPSIGVALEPWTSSERGAILAFVDPGWHGGTSERVREARPVVERPESPEPDLPVAIDPIAPGGEKSGGLLRADVPGIAESFRTSSPVEVGDVVALDASTEGRVHLVEESGAPSVIGVVVDAPGLLVGSSDSDSVAVALLGTTRCKVDAGFGAIRPGDLLTTSPTPGHAMRAVDPPPGAVFAKALEPLDVGMGTIRVLLWAR